MRVLVAPDAFTGTLTATQAAVAIRRGWARSAPADELDLAPLSDGGPGFVEVMYASLGGQLVSETVTGPLREPVQATWLLGPDGTAYVEAASACGLHLIPDARRDPAVTTSAGVGDLIAAAVARGARRVIVGVGGTGTTDAGAGLLAALGATADHPEVLTGGGGGLRSVTAVDLAPARAAMAGVELVVASDVDVPLLGLRGASNGFARQKGADDASVMLLEGSLEAFAAAVGRQPADDAPGGRDPAVALGAGAGGGLGYALLALGGRRVPGIATVTEAVGLTGRAAAADLVLTGEGTFDWQSLRGKVVAGVAAAALPSARPVVVLAGRVAVGRREWVAIGVSAAYAVSDIAPTEAVPPPPGAAAPRSGDAAPRSDDAGPGFDDVVAGSGEAVPGPPEGDPAELLAALAARVAKSWSR
ncbi:MAG: glycerate kinase [Actinomycetota bacterium]|nr:MAG: glycerate kinase [Actinomycetota bacterium]